MYSLRVENENGGELMLQPNPNYTIGHIEGLNPPPAAISGISLPVSDGQILSNSRIDTRHIVLTIYINNPVETNRIELYKFFRVKRLVRLFFKNGTRDLMAEGYVETFEFDLFSMRQAAQISIRCVNPYLLSKIDKRAELRFNTESFEYPFEIPDPPGEVMSERKRHGVLTLKNEGDVESGCLIRIKALRATPTPIRIFDEVSNTSMTIGQSMSKNSTLTIDTKPGQRSISYNAYNSKSAINWVKYLTIDSKWITIKPGVNVFAYQVGNDKLDTSQGQANLKLVEITFTYRENFLGV